MLLAGLVLALGPGREPACLASDDDGSRVVQSPSAVEFDFVPASDADWKTEGPAKGSWYGYSVDSAGNVDGHHGDDVLVSAPKYGDTNGEGTVYLYLSTGGALNDMPVWEKRGGMGGALFGWSVAGAGDVDNDGRDDVIIGAPNYKTEFQVGRAFVYQGDPGLGLTLDHTWSYTGTVRDAEFGYAVAGAGNLNGDEFDDIVVGARWYTDEPVIDPNKRNGAIYVFFGQIAGPSAEPDWLIEGEQAGAWLGAAVSAAGDVNHDGYDDLLVGAPNYLNPETSEMEGAALLFLGGDSPPTSHAWIAYGGQAGAKFGSSVAGAGDVNGDGRPDVVISAPGYHRPSDDVLVGAAFAFCGNGAGLGSAPCWMVEGGQPGGGFGASAAAAGDVNADGYDDVIVGAPTYLPDPDTGFEGAAFVYFGSATGLSPLAGWKVGGDRSRTDLGWAVGSAGQVTYEDADGVLIGAPQYFRQSDPYGAAFAFYGPLEPAELERIYLPLVVRGAH